MSFNQIRETSMKHRAVEALVRAQFNINDNIDVTVKMLMYVDGFYDFAVEWCDGYIINTCELKLPQIGYTFKNLSLLQ